MYVWGGVAPTGTALAETVAQNTNTASASGGWGGDDSHSPFATYPWFMRGGQSLDGAGAGVFAFSGDAGGTHGGRGWRVVVSGGSSHRHSIS